MSILLESRLLAAIPGVRHGFSTRLGGISEGPWATLDLARDGEPDAARLENRRRFARALGLEGPGALVEVVQVHGVAVVDAAEVTGEREADGLFTATPGRAVGVRTADCAPLLLAAVRGGRAAAVAAVHAGWRGATAGIVDVALARLDGLGFSRRDLTVAIGPTIGLDAFEVGEEVVDAARSALGGAEPRILRDARGKARLDLVDLLATLLERGGVDPARIERVGGCTASNPQLYYSHRRDRGRTGRHLSAIRLDPGEA